PSRNAPSKSANRATGNPASDLGPLLSALLLGRPDADTLRSDVALRVAESLSNGPRRAVSRHAGLYAQRGSGELAQAARFSSGGHRSFAIRACHAKTRATAVASQTVSHLAALVASSYRTIAKGLSGRCRSTSGLSVWSGLLRLVNASAHRGV